MPTVLFEDVVQLEFVKPLRRSEAKAPRVPRRCCLILAVHGPHSIHTLTCSRSLQTQGRRKKSGDINDMQ